MLVNNGNYRSPLLIETLTTGSTLFNGTTVYGNVTVIVDIRNAFSNDSFSYTAISDLEFAALSDSDYFTRRNDFLTLFSSNMTNDQRLQLVSTSNGTDTIMCPLYLPPPTTTTTTTIAPTTTTTTTQAPAVFFSFIYNSFSLMKTVNGGITWTLIPVNGGVGITYINDISVLDNTIFVIGVDNSGSPKTVFFKSLDLGVTWNSVTVPVALHNYSTVMSTFNMDANTYLIGTNGLNILTDTYRSTNGGTSFTIGTKPNGMSMRIIKFPNNNAAIGYTLDTNKIAKTTNFGQTWVDVTGAVMTSVNTGLANLNFYDVNNGFVVGSNMHLFKTIDGGASWTEMTGPNFPIDHALTPYYSAVYAFDSQNIVIVGHSIFSYTTYVSKTTNGGASWSPIQTFANLNAGDIDFYNGNGVIVGNSGQVSGGNNLVSSDYGATWSLVANQSTTSIRVISPKPSIFA